jgi:hypothetical protein
MLKAGLTNSASRIAILLATLYCFVYICYGPKVTYGQSRIMAAGYGCKTDKRLNSIIIMHRHSSVSSSSRSRSEPFPNSISPGHALHSSIVFQRRARQAVSEA